MDVLGMLYALLAGGAWAIYIVLGGRVAEVLPGNTGVAVGMLLPPWRWCRLGWPVGTC